jgi:hypothetical protein
VGADYRVRAYAVRTPVRIVGETVRDMGYGSGVEPVEHETWLVQGKRRVVRVRDHVVHPTAARVDGRWAPVFWEGADVVRLVERDRGVAITFLHEVRIEPAFLSDG